VTLYGEISTVIWTGGTHTAACQQRLTSPSSSSSSQRRCFCQRRRPTASSLASRLPLMEAISSLVADYVRLHLGLCPASQRWQVQLQHLCHWAIAIFKILFRAYLSILWPPYVIGGPLYFCPVVSFYLLLLLFPRLISAATDWMSTILLHMAWP